MDKILQELKLQQDVITGFSFSFSSALLQKLKELRDENRVFEKDSARMTEIANVVMYHLDNQIPTGISCPQDMAEINNVISICEEFLLVFTIGKPAETLQKIDSVVDPKLNLSEEVKALFFLPLESVVIGAHGNIKTKMVNMFSAQKIFSVAYLTAFSPEEIGKFRYFGPKCKEVLDNFFPQEIDRKLLAQRMHHYYRTFSVVPLDVPGLVNNADYQVIISRMNFFKMDALENIHPNIDMFDKEMVSLVNIEWDDYEKGTRTSIIACREIIVRFLNKHLRDYLDTL